jgi:hypothetical protein
MTELLRILTDAEGSFGTLTTNFDGGWGDWGGGVVAAQSPNFFSNCYIWAYLKGIIYSKTFNMTDGLYF